MMLQVGELAKRAGLTVRTLHHYDEIGLLKPSGRSESGYRLYDQADVARLHAIQALRQLGLPLADISGLMAEGDSSPGLIIEQQMHALERQIAHATELRDRLALMRDGLLTGKQPGISDWLDTLGLMNTFGKYFNAAELRRIFLNWRRVEADWSELVEQVRAAMAEGLAVDALPVQRLAHRWMLLMLYWMEGDFALIERWGAMFAREPGARAHAPSAEVIDYMQRALDARHAVLVRHLSETDVRRLRRVPWEEWKALEVQIQALLREGVAVSSPRAHAAAREWNTLVDLLVDGDPDLRARLAQAWAAEPMLRAGSALSAESRAFVEAAWQNLLDPHAT